MSGKRFALYVTANPVSGQGQLSALRFATAAIGSGHVVARIFFAGEAVLIGNGLMDTPGDEPQLQQQWTQLAAQHGSELLLCSAAAQRYGIVAETGSDADPRATLAAGFNISGLGSLVESALDCDRVLHFPG
ncbi:sulfurtransferase complex subunit TusD [Permianibacter sp. IMCC34836]|uniref:sulfurtransferase complex subunit TusD n=1 Tax=Permianibacter fluminis TaxID=2738515 RepID=UPI0015534BD5|nr:sulfurtransferase complex subunit TusD [Permianibacter fluminis]NQD38175.1 sulfurtransferase complex subunit TusD [Permianibacter fluminis]